jgi:hypothetical protein
MAYVTPRMSLKVWNSASDPYDHEQLADNFLKLDQHDHSSGRGVKIGAGGLQDFAIGSNHFFPGAVNAAALATGAVTTTKLADANITTAKYLDASVTDAKLASPQNGIYHISMRTYGFLTSANTGTGTFMINGSYVASATTGASPIYLLPITGSEYAVAGKTTKLRLRTAWATNNVAPGNTATLGLYPVSVSGTAGAGLWQITLGTVVSGSTVVVTTPGPNTASPVVGSDFTIPADGLYTVGVSLSAGGAANSAIQFSTGVGMRWV